MIRQYGLNEFREKYCFNSRREFLYGLLLEELEWIKTQCACCRILVFGSFITIKGEPKDIDILVSLIPDSDYVYNFMTSGLERRHPEKIDIQYNKTQYALKDAQDLIDFFNENPLNKNKNVRIKRAVELVDF